MPTYANSTNLTISSLQHYFKTVYDSEGGLPPYCFLQMDNAAKDNKNATMFAYLSLLVERNWFSAVFLHFLPPGHTHSNLDQKYSVISQRLKNKDIFTLTQLQQELDSLFPRSGAHTGQFEVSAVGDYTAYFAGITNKLHGQGTSSIRGRNRRIHAFKIAKDTTGRVGVFFKEHDDFGPWRGQWDDNDKAIYVLKKDWARENRTLKASPKLRIDELAAIETHWGKILEVVDKCSSVEEAFSQPPIETSDCVSGDDSSDDLDNVLEDSDVDGDDDGPLPVKEDFARKWNDGTKWWDALFAQEKAFWSSRAADCKEADFPVQPKDEAFITLPTHLPQRQHQVTPVEITNMDTLAAVGDLRPELGEQLQKLRDISRRLFVNQEEELFLYSSEGKKPEKLAPYQVEEDLKVGHIAVVQVKKDESSGGRGWDLMKITSISQGMTNGVTGVYVMPQFTGDRALTYTESVYPAWPEGWMKQPLIPISLGQGRTRVLWTDTINILTVLFSFEPESVRRGRKKDVIGNIPGRFMVSLTKAITAIEHNCVPRALDSESESESEPESDWDSL